MHFFVSVCVAYMCYIHTWIFFRIPVMHSMETPTVNEIISFIHVVLV